jgi:hypothetical protein
MLSTIRKFNDDMDIRRINPYENNQFNNKNNNDNNNDNSNYSHYKCYK